MNFSLLSAYNATSFKDQCIQAFFQASDDQKKPWRRHLSLKFNEYLFPHVKLVSRPVYNHIKQSVVFTVIVDTFCQACGQMRSYQIVLVEQAATIDVELAPVFVVVALQVDKFLGLDVR